MHIHFTLYGDKISLKKKHKQEPITVFTKKTLVLARSLKSLSYNRRPTALCYTSHPTCDEDMRLLLSVSRTRSRRRRRGVWEDRWGGGGVGDDDGLTRPFSSPRILEHFLLSMTTHVYGPMVYISMIFMSETIICIFNCTSTFFHCCCICLFFVIYEYIYAKML